MQTVDQLLGLLGPSADDQRAARQAAILQFGLGLLGTPKGQEWAGIRNAAQAGLLGRQQYLDDEQQQRMRALQVRGTALDYLNRQSQYDDAELLRKQQAEAAQRFALQTGLQPTGIGGSSTFAPSPITGVPTSIANSPPASAFGMNDRGIGPAPSLLAPTLAPQTPMVSGAAPMPGMPDRRQTAARYKALADYWSSVGRFPQAQTYYKAAQDAMPKLKDQKTLTQNGRRVVVNLYDDGSTQIVPGVGPDMEKAHFLDTGSIVGAVDPFTGTPIPGGGLYNKTTTPDALLSANTSIRGQDLSAQTARRGQDMNAATAKARLDQDINGIPEQFGQPAIDAMAARYNIDGTIPPLGMGRASVAARATIVNRAAELAAQAGVSPTDQRVNQLTNKASAGAMNTLTRQQTMVSAFENTFNKNADLVLEASTKVDRTGAPLINSWLNAGKRSLTGNPELAAFDTAIKSASNEYAKIISGSMGNTPAAESEIKKMDSLLNAQQTPEGVIAVIQMMRRDTQNRMAGFREEKQTLREGMSGRPQATAPGAPPSGLMRNATAIAKAREAIKAGKDPAAVRAYLQQNGYDPTGL
jgi:hypothetical protein